MEKEQIEALGITYVEGMTDAQVVEEITKLRKADSDKITELDGKAKTFKAQFDKASSEIAGFKAKEKANLTAEEQAKLEMENLKASLAEANKKIELGEKVKGLTGQGIPTDVAEKLATKLVEGKDISKDLGDYLKSRDEALKQEIMKSNPNPSGGGGNGGNGEYTREKFLKGEIPVEKLNEIQQTNPELFKTLLGK